MKRPRSRIAMFSVLLLSVIIFGTVLFLWNTGTEVFQPASDSSKSIPFEIRPNESAADIADDLQKKGLIRNALAFRLWAHVKGLDTQFEAGVYKGLKPNMTINDIAQQLLNGKPDAVPVLVIEGYRLEQIADAVTGPKLPNFKRAEFLNFAKHPETLPGHDQYDFLKYIPKGSGMEGMLFPTTYEIPIESNAEQVINIMLKQMQTVIKQNNLEDLAKQHHYDNIYQMIILSSIVEKESRLDKYRTQIASVYWNRLYIPNNETIGRLQADPTVQYARDTIDQPQKYWQPLQDKPDNVVPDSAWNTYTQKGLPPTPICSPSLNSLTATASPAQTKYLYFFGAKDGNTYFAETNDKFEQLKQQYGVQE